MWKCQILTKTRKNAKFRLFSKNPKNVDNYPISDLHAKFWGPRIKNEFFRAKKLILKISENIGYLRLKFLHFFQILSPPSVFALET